MADKEYLTDKGVVVLDPSEPGVTPPVIAPGYDFGKVTEKIGNVVLTKRTPLSWIFGVLILLGFLGMLNVAIGYLLLKGTGIWGIQIPNGWGFAITNFVRGY